jgi:hypothetical protein
MLLPKNDKVLLALLMQSSVLGLLRAGGIYRLIMFDEPRIDQSTLDIYGDHWQMSLDDFIENVRGFDHEANEHFLLYYPESTNQMMLESIYSTAPTLGPIELASYVKMFRPIQRGKISKS